MTTKQPGKGWWVFAVLLLLLFIILQLPAAWIIARVSPNNPYIDSISGSVWQGQADWHVEQVQGVMSWKLRPWSLLLLRLGADVELLTGETRLNGKVAVGFKQRRIEQLNGQISTQTLSTLLPWQWPNNPIQLHHIKVIHHEQKGWQQADGQLNWTGGMLGYPFEGRVERANLPPLAARLSAEKGRLQLNLSNLQNERMGDIYLSSDNMLEVQLTQRLLLTVAGYRGQAGLDTAVVSTRQPLSSLRAP
ncbi:type II secretion system protein N [Alkanindiges sp. WGS2144]|uniref:type II secretion system protein N n=1 Tax=Alkanindiges sp. WGS2144 TaxID=3366808 RepID=UPI003750295D